MEYMPGIVRYSGAADVTLNVIVSISMLTQVWLSAADKWILTGVIFQVVWVKEPFPLPPNADC